MYRAVLRRCALVLIEPYWNVKKVNLDCFCLEVVVLIEPYWNVKDRYYQAACKPGLVLIEPYWNVKRKI